MTDLDQWLEMMRLELTKRTGRGDIRVTGGPWRAYDVRVEQEEGHPKVDFYSAMRLDPVRVRAAMDYAVMLIEDWEATLAEHAREMELVKPIFNRLQGQFPQYELRHLVSFAETHFVTAERKDERVVVSFDLWPGMGEADVQRLEDSIRELGERVAMPGGPRAVGTEYRR